ncbi:MAG: mechanosensitive ion channel family protein [Deltaproteobacteria bacterium]|nr:mechanosensitive ion channel family protein [Deltaproteobacteria bacterium]
MDWLSNWYFLDQSLRLWALALGLGALAVVVLLAFKKLVVSRVVRMAGHNEHAAPRFLGGVLQGTRAWFYVIGGIYVGSLPLDLEGRADLVLHRFLVLALLLQLGLWCQVAVRLGVARWRHGHADSPDATTAAAGVDFVLRLVLWALIFTLALGNLGIEISALVAGLGIGGIAAALAVQNVLGDLFASLSIYFDRPFDIGDFIIVDDLMGSVSRIGMRSTQVRSLSGEQLIFPNSDLAKSRIKNYKRMDERRIVFSIGVTYETPYALVARVPQMLREAVEQAGNVRFDRSHFQTYGDSSLVFETVYYVLSPDYNVFMDTQQSVNLAIFERFEREGIDFAYPTRTLHVHTPTPAAEGSDEDAPGEGAPSDDAPEKPARGTSPHPS